MQLQGGISERSFDARGRERRADGANDHPGSAGAASENKSRDHNVVAGIDETARADVSQLSGTGATQVVYFHERDTARGTAASDDGGVSARRKRREDRCFVIVGRR